MPKNRVHLILGSHDKEGFFSRRKKPLLGTKTFLFEDADGLPLGVKFNSNALFRGNTHFSKDALEFIERARKRGVDLKVGETTYNKREATKLHYLYDRYDRLDTAFTKDLDYQTFVATTRALGEFTRFRHYLIRRAIKDALKKGGVEARYGTSHAILRRELISEGVPTTREMLDAQFPVEDRALAKITRGKPPTELELKRAYVETMFNRLLSSNKFNYLVWSVLSERRAENSHSKNDQIKAFIRTLAMKVPEKQLDEIVHTKNAEQALLQALPNGFFSQVFSKFGRDTAVVDAIASTIGGKRRLRVIEELAKKEAEGKALKPRLRPPRKTGAAAKTNTN